jgi:hypothetical protein
VRRLVLLVVVVLVVATVAAGGWWYARRNTSTPVTPDQAVERFQEATTTVPAPASTTTVTRGTTAAAATSTTTSGPPTTAPVAVLPELGVYVYDTTGSDSVDALGGASHQYPSTTTITVEPGGCGIRQRWQPLEERWDEWTTCAEPGGVQLTSFTGYHRFFGQDTTDEWVCAGDPRPVRAAPGTTWRTTCLEAGAPTEWVGTVVGDESLLVGSDPVRVQHVRIDLDDGVSSDVQRFEAWYLEGSDLLVRQVADMATANESAVGTVHYREQYTIQLASLVPRR